MKPVFCDILNKDDLPVTGWVRKSGGNTAYAAGKSTLLLYWEDEICEESKRESRESVIRFSER